jgi:hypothetical protein
MKRSFLAVLAATFGILLTGARIRAAEAQPKEQTATIENDASKQVITRVYDVRSLMAPIPDFSLDTSPHGPGFKSAPGQAPSANADSAMTGNVTAQQVRPVLYGSSGPTGGGAREATKPGEPQVAGDQQDVDSVIKLIQETVDPESWKDNGGQTGTLRLMRGRLVVTQNAANQKAVESLLKQLSEGQELVRVTADWVMLSPADLAKLTKPQAAGKATSGARVVDSAVLEKMRSEQMHFHAELVGFSAQTVHLVSGRERTLVTNATPVVSTDAVAYSPILSNVGGGLALQVNPRIDPDHQTALVTLLSTYTEVDQPTTAPAEVTSTTRPSDRSQVLSGRETVRLQGVAEVVQELQTSVRLPLGVPVIVGGMTLEPTTSAANSPELVLILTVTAAE